MAMSLGSFASRVVATKVVATDGTGDFTDIQSAINALPSGGGVVYVKEGTYTITSSLSITTDNVALIGAGKSTEVKTTTAIDSLTASSVSGLLIESIYFNKTVEDDGIVFTTVTDSIIKGCWVTGAGNAIYLKTDSNYNTIINNHIFTNPGEGILVFSGANNIVSNNICWDNSGSGIYISTKNNIISNNICYNGQGDGIFIEGDENIITSNQCVDNTTANDIGIEIHTTADKNIVIGNIALRNTAGQITDNGTNTQLAHNIVT